MEPNGKYQAIEWEDGRWQVAFIDREGGQSYGIDCDHREDARRIAALLNAASVYSTEAIEDGRVWVTLRG